MIECAQLHFNIYKEIEAKLDTNQWYQHVQKLVDVECKANEMLLKTGANRTTYTSFIKYLSKLPGKQEIKELQKSAILNTARIFRRVLV
jgi:hypothetical protein